MHLVNYPTVVLLCVLILIVDLQLAAKQQSLNPALSSSSPLSTTTPPHPTPNPSGKGKEDTAHIFPFVEGKRNKEWPGSSDPSHQSVTLPHYTQYTLFMRRSVWSCYRFRCQSSVAQQSGSCSQACKWNTPCCWRQPTKLTKNNSQSPTVSQRMPCMHS